MNDQKLIIAKRTLHQDCTTAEWFHLGERICYSIERPWLSNIPFKSCVPPGDYTIKKISTNKHPDSFYLENKNLGVSWNSNTIRTAIEVHIANRVEEVVGCMGPGLELRQRIGDTPFVVSSKDAMAMLNKLINDDDWIIRIENG